MYLKLGLLSSLNRASEVAVPPHPATATPAAPAGMLEETLAIDRKIAPSLTDPINLFNKDYDSNNSNVIALNSSSQFACPKCKSVICAASSPSTSSPLKKQTAHSSGRTALAAVGSIIFTVIPSPLNRNTGK